MCDEKGGAQEAVVPAGSEPGSLKREFGPDDDEASKGSQDLSGTNLDGEPLCDDDGHGSTTSGVAQQSGRNVTIAAGKDALGRALPQESIEAYTPQQKYVLDRLLEV